MVSEQDKLFISPPVCNILFISFSASSKIFILLKKNSMCKVGSQTRLSINVGLKQTSKVRLQQINDAERSEGNYFFKAIAYLLTIYYH